MNLLRPWRTRAHRDRIPQTEWTRLCERLVLTKRLSPRELERLQVLSLSFLKKKQIVGAQGFSVSSPMALVIAAQACVPIINLGLDYYDNWMTVVVYPDSFISRMESEDEAGVVHQTESVRVGEAWERGPVVLSWGDIIECAYQSAGYNVIVHECAHKLDMLSGTANGMPPLHRDMDRSHWTSALSSAYRKVRRSAGIQRSSLDEYAGESPEEFFAVASEAFFGEPTSLLLEFPDVYDQLRSFYRQDPAKRIPEAVPVDLVRSLE